MIALSPSGPNLPRRRPPCRLCNGPILDCRFRFSRPAPKCTDTCCTLHQNRSVPGAKNETSWANRFPGGTLLLPWLPVRWSSRSVYKQNTKQLTDIYFKRMRLTSTSDHCFLGKHCFSIVLLTFVLPTATVCVGIFVWKDVPIIFYTYTIERKREIVFW